AELQALRMTLCRIEVTQGTQLSSVWEQLGSALGSVGAQPRPGGRLRSGRRDAGGMVRLARPGPPGERVPAGEGGRGGGPRPAACRVLPAKRSDLAVPGSATAGINCLEIASSCGRCGAFRRCPISARYDRARVEPPACGAAPGWRRIGGRLCTPAL